MGLSVLDSGCPGCVLFWVPVKCRVEGRPGSRRRFLLRCPTATGLTPVPPGLAVNSFIYSMVEKRGVRRDEAMGDGKFTQLNIPMGDCQAFKAMR